tara:strand:- start:2792 stop:3169 length:378 start_codon:yes stop_codon:yes gene_type:complete
MIATSDIILSVLSGVLSMIFMRIYDKFYNKQYTKGEYFKIGILNCISTLTILYLNSILAPTLPSNKFLKGMTVSNSQSGGNGSNVMTNGGSIVNKMTSALNDNLDYFNPDKSSHTMKFKTGTPNF